MTRPFGRVTRITLEKNRYYAIVLMDDKRTAYFDNRDVAGAEMPPPESLVIFDLLEQPEDVNKRPHAINVEIASRPAA